MTAAPAPAPAPAALPGGGEVAALGEALAIAGLGLVGVRLVPADGPAQVRSAWPGLTGAGLVILTAAAAQALGPDRVAAGTPLTVVLPP
jgi:hypothetical protein